jgi:hypothetical protein
VFVTSQGHLTAQFAQACERGNYAAAVALADRLKPLSLVEALSLLPLIAAHAPAKYDAAAVRWHARWQLEGRGGPDLADSALALGALGALRGPRQSDALRLLRGLV